MKPFILHIWCFLTLFGVFSDSLKSQAVLQGTVSFLNSGSRPAVGVDISAFGATTVPTTASGMFILKFPNRKPGDKVKIIVGRKDHNGTFLDLVNEKVLEQMHIPSKPDDDILEVLVCKYGERDKAMIRFYDIIVKNINEDIENRLKEINGKLDATKIDVETVVALQKEKDKLAAERDSALAKAEEQASFMASINLDKANRLVREAMTKVDSFEDIHGAIAVLDNEMLLKAYEEAKGKVRKAKKEIDSVIEAYNLKIRLLVIDFQNAELNKCCSELEKIYKEQNYDSKNIYNCFVWALVAPRSDRKDIIQRPVTYYAYTTPAYDQKEQPATTSPPTWAYEEAGYFSRAAVVQGEIRINIQKDIALNLDTLAMREKTLPADHPDLAISYNYLAYAYGYIGQYQKALMFNLKAVAIYEKMVPDDNKELAISYNNLAATYRNLGQYQEATKFILKELAIIEKKLPTPSAQLATRYKYLAETYLNLKDYQKSLEFNLKSLAIYEKVMPVDSPDLAILYSSLAYSYGHVREYQKAVEFNLKAVSIQEKVLSKNHPDIAVTYNNLSLNFIFLNEYQKALEFNLKSLDVFEKNRSKDYFLLATVYNNVAVNYDKLGEYQKALEFNHKVLGAYEKVLSSKHPDLAISYSNLARAYVRIHKYQEALEFNLKSVSILEKALHSKHPDLATSYDNLSLAYWNIGNYQKSLDYDLKALDIYEKILPTNDPNLVIVYSNMGRAFRDAGKYNEGIKYGQKAIQMGETSNPKHRSLHRCYANLGITYVKSGQYSKAKTVFEKSERLKPEERVYRGWAMYYALQNKKKQAIKSLQKATSIGFKNLRWLETEPDLKNIRNEKGYKNLVEQLKKQ